VAEIVFDIATGEPKLTRERGNAARLGGEQFEKIATKRH
jgi:hypothetical protein